MSWLRLAWIRWLYESPGLDCDIWQSKCCNAPTWRRSVEHPWRCTACGHRFAWNMVLGADYHTGYEPRQTRSKPPWQWPGELIDRRKARRSR